MTRLSFVMKSKVIRKQNSLPMIKHPNLLRSKLFLLGVVTLAVNDHYLKLAYPNWFTGKLSDFAGLFILPIFLTAISPRLIKLNYIFSALVFIIWKSPLVEPLIDAGNAIGIPLHRTIDPTDLIALTILPLSHAYASRIPVSGMINNRWAINSLAAICFLTLTATSFVPIFSGDVNKSYKFKTSKSQLLKDIEQLNCDLALQPSTNGDSIYILKNLIVENDSVIRAATFSIKAKNNHSVLTLQHIEIFHPTHAFFTWGVRRSLRRVAKKYLIEEIPVRATE